MSKGEMTERERIWEAESGWRESVGGGREAGGREVGVGGRE